MPGSERLVAIGEIGRPHGLAGEVHVTPLTDDPGRFARLAECVVWDAGRDVRERRRLRAARAQGTAMVVALEGCDSVDAARGLRGRLLAVAEADALPLPSDRFYAWQLEGCRVETEAGVDVGVVTGLEHTAAHDLWVVRDGAREHLIPAVPAIVAELDLAGRRVVIRPPDGLLEL